MTQHNLDKSKVLLESTFKMIDLNGDGTISCDELRALFGDQSWSEIIGETDLDQDGVISFEEFYQGMIKLFD